MRPSRQFIWISGKFIWLFGLSMYVVAAIRQKIATVQDCRALGAAKNNAELDKTDTRMELYITFLVQSMTRHIRNRQNWNYGGNSNDI